MYNSSQNISIHAQNQELTFNEGKYHVDVLGGWSVRKNGFSIRLINKESGVVVYTTNSWPVQNLYGFFKRGKRIFTFSINEKGIYTLEFKNSENLLVKASNSLMFGWVRNYIFNGIVENSAIRIVVYRR